ncbi:MAG: histidine phosphatase family protein [bacterium]|nr:histidine phosphatase family protein [bacterium]MCM1374669.1 histidine phosphatase family protein [Muribaculum sp.]
MTIFYFVRHGEPDYQSVGDWGNIPFGKEFAGLTASGEEQILAAARELRKVSPQIIISSPYARALQSAGIMARELSIRLCVERDLHEWDSDRTHSVREQEELLRLCQEYDACEGVYPPEGERTWESRQLVRDRVLKVLEKYAVYERVVVAGHAIMMQAVTGEYRPFAYGEIVQWSREDMANQRTTPQ